ncbi:nodulation protein H [Cinnamomum micranthum f. kanehirae]|uniref:Nodulation protein H n=1 Tax=Cinnamomum micranthum f. kanehirae TaxID=337451 RepID=A0A443PP66_9MAGN|nr:nodulation protein H [Cinnamomum micranthum f. kanehirae]
MAEDYCFFGKDMLVIKPPKKSPIVLRATLVIFAMMCGCMICSICLKQISTHVKPPYVNLQKIKQPSDFSGIFPWEKPLAHYPKPKTYSRKECSCNPVRFFAILSMQRSGSGWFETLLNSHINISSNGEIFSVQERRSNVSAILSTLDEVYNLDWLSSASKNECSAAVGFKWMLNQGVVEFHEEIVEYFNRRGVSVIFLFRKNPLRRLVSVLANSYDRQARLLNGTHKSHVHSIDEVPLLLLFCSNSKQTCPSAYNNDLIDAVLVQATVLATYKPVINCASLINDLEVIENATADALEYFRSTRHIILYYEDLMNNRTKLMDVQDFLRVPQRNLESRQVKIHTRPLFEHVENWDEVSKVLNGTKYENLLHSRV